MLLKLEEEGCKAKEHFSIHQNYVKHWSNRKYAGAKSFDVGDLVLKWDKPHENKVNTQSSNLCELDYLLLMKILAIIPLS